MSTAKTCRIESSSYEDTYETGKRFGSRCKGGEVFVLSSDLGGGKTTFTKGLAAGLGSDDVVSSPTFTVSNVYECRDNLTLHHFDFYRLNEAGVVAHELAEVVDDPSVIAVIEWGDIVSEVLPERSIVINFDRSSKGEDVREITINFPEEANYLA